MQTLPQVVPVNMGMSCPMPPRPPKLLTDCPAVAPPCMPQFQELCRQFFINPVPGCAAQTFVELLRNHFLVLKQVIDLTYAIYSHLQLASISLPNAHSVHAQLYERFCCERKELFNQNLLQSAFDGVCLLRGRGYNPMFLHKWVEALMSISYFFVKHAEARLWEQADLIGELENQIALALRTMSQAIPALANVVQFNESMSQYFRNIAQYIEYFSRVGGQLNSCVTIIQNGVNLADAAGSLIDTVITQGAVPPLPQPTPTSRPQQQQQQQLALKDGGGGIDSGTTNKSPQKIVSVEPTVAVEEPFEEVVEQQQQPAAATTTQGIVDESQATSVSKEAVAEVEKSAMRFQSKSASRKLNGSNASMQHHHTYASSLSRANFSSMK